MAAHSAEVPVATAAFRIAAVHVVEVRSAAIAAVLAVVRSAAIVVVHVEEVHSAAIAAVLAEVAHMATAVIANSELQHPDLSIHHTQNFAH